jgi:galactosyl transferase GMA12/MNN10 family
LAVTLPSFERYAALHGYELHIPDADPSPERNHKQWAKIAFINQLLPTCDFLLWIDCDAAVVDFSMDMASALPHRRFLGMVEHRYDRQRVPTRERWRCARVGGQFASSRRPGISPSTWRRRGTTVLRPWRCSDTNSIPRQSRCTSIPGPRRRRYERPSSSATSGALYPRTCHRRLAFFT